MKKDWKEEVLEEIRQALETMEAAGEAPQDMSELAQLTIAMSQKAGQRAFEAWMRFRAEKASFSP